MRRAGIYARISDDPEGKGLGVTRQVKSCRELAERLRWEVVEVYVDNDVSATRSRSRPQYDLLLGDIEDGFIDAVLVWSLDRLHRRPLELEHFIALAERKGTALANVSGNVDLGTTDGQLHARLMGAVAAAESRRISDRVKNKQRQLREAGRPATGGKRCFGWEADRMTLIPAEAAEIRGMVALLLSGHSFGAIARDLNDRNVQTVSQWTQEQKPIDQRDKDKARPWGLTSVRSLLALPRLYGKMTYKGEVIGDGVWQPILDERTWRQVQSAMRVRSVGYSKATARGKYLLSGIATCGVCGAGLQFSRAGQTKTKQSNRYRCGAASRGLTETSGHGQRNMQQLDKYVTDALFLVIDAQEYLPEPAEDVTAEIDDLRQRLNDAADQYAEGLIDGEQLARISSRLRPQIEALEVKQTGSGLKPLMEWYFATTDRLEALQRWDELDVSQQRAMISAHLGQRGFIRVHKKKKQSRSVEPETIHIRWSLGNEGAMPPDAVPK